jgi:hypothetical protein
MDCDGRIGKGFILTQAEMQQKIEALREPGDLFFFYIARGTV